MERKNALVGPPAAYGQRASLFFGIRNRALG
jgi:hypothetical protein